MFVSKHTLKRLSGGIAIGAALVVVAVPSALAGGFITDTLGGTGSAKATPDAFERAVAIHNTASAQPYVNGGMSSAVATSNDPVPSGVTTTPDAFERAVAIHNAAPAQPYVNGGMSPAVATSNDPVPSGVPTVAVVSTGGTGFNWGYAGIGAGIAAGLALLLLIGAPRLRSHKSRVLAA
jgi:hypothetical protein